ncbi:MAG TPA: hypothetical protein VJZ00_09310 [Thermoanaerobaculia bacterium]|nr:hypothetical protein [Thermoanaerobaculia bacterium]
MKRLALVLLVAVPAFARVLSYAPYSNQPSRSGEHTRTTRHFVVLEGPHRYFDRHSEVVLYDSAGLEEPRVVFPQSGTAAVEHAALYEPHGSATPLLLVFADNKYSFSADGGVTWKPIAIENYTVNDPIDVDFGGPFVHGLGTQILPGTDAWPFVLAQNYGLYAIDAKGAPKLLAAGQQNGWPQLAGRNAAGDRFLVNIGNEVRMVDLAGHSTVLTKFSDTGGSVTGWITSDGTVYIQRLRVDGRFLYLWRNGELSFLLGPYDAQGPLGPPVQSHDTMRFFAIPTHDFNGAWMIQRETGKPTTLLRHTVSTGIQTMWTDVSGPEVEALIAGASGNTLLVQVHRRRDDLGGDRLFIDPALAVWHVGEPAPRAYDELYLREQWNKGFVHVDPDLIAGGEPFVFNSGYQDETDIIVSPPVGGGGDVLQEWGVVRTSLQQRLVLPGVARLHGAFDSYWLTDVTIFNPLDTPQTVDVRFVALGEEVAAAGGRVTRLTLQPHEIRAIPDALAALFGIEDGGGALHFLPASAINVTGRTYSRTANGGTFGFGMQAIDFYNAGGPRFPMTFAGAFPGEHFRTNLLLTDTSGRGTTAEINATGISGTIGAADFTVTAPSSGIMQINGLRAPLSLLASDAGGLIVRPTRGTAIPTLVAIDNRTNDPTYFPPDLPTFEARTIPVIGHLDGANGARFRSDVYLLNPTPQPRTVVLEAKQWDSETRKAIQFSLLPNEARVVPDALTTLFGMSGFARLRYDTGSGPSTEGVRVTSRTYTEERGGATYGCLIPPLNNFQRGAPGDVLEILGITGGGNFRANLGLVELSPSGTQGTTLVRISIVDGANKVLDSFSVNVPRAGGMQINDIFHSRGIAAPEAAIVYVRVADGGTIGAYATLTDNLTNDSTYLAAQLGARTD